MLNNITIFKNCEKIKLLSNRGNSCADEILNLYKHDSFDYCSIFQAFVVK